MDKTKNSPDLSIVIPVLNEAKRIGSTLDELADYLSKHDQNDAEVILVLANSKDKTLEIAQAKLAKFKNARIIRSGRTIGKGHQVQKGMLEAKGQYRLFMDADLATPLHHIESALAKLRGGADVVIAVRDLAKIHHGLRKYISELSNLIAKVILLLPFKDTQCGFKAFSGQAADMLFSRQRIMKWVFDMEILSIAKKHKLRVETVFAGDWHDVPDGTFQKVGLKDTLSTFVDIVCIRLNLWTGRYK